MGICRGFCPLGQYGFQQWLFSQWHYCNLCSGNWEGDSVVPSLGQRDHVCSMLTTLGCTPTPWRLWIPPPAVTAGILHLWSWGPLGYLILPFALQNVDSSGHVVVIVVLVYFFSLLKLSSHILLYMRFTCHLCWLSVSLNAFSSQCSI